MDANQFGKDPNLISELDQDGSEDMVTGNEERQLTVYEDIVEADFRRVILNIVSKPVKGVLETALTSMAYSGKLKFQKLRLEGGPDFYLSPMGTSPATERIKNGVIKLMIMRRVKMVAERASMKKNNKLEMDQVFNTWTVNVYKESIKTVP